MQGACRWTRSSTPTANLLVTRARKPPMAHAPSPNARDLFTEAQIEEFLGLIRQGIGRHLAAQRIGATGTQMRTLCRRDRDPQFAEVYEAAVEEGKAFYQDRLEAEVRQRALNQSDRLLEVELATHVPRYAHLRRDRVQVNGKIEHEHALVLQLNPDVLDTWPLDKLLALRETLAELGGGLVVDGEFAELPVGGPEGDSQAA